jgi:hypothetical protein
MNLRDTGLDDAERQANLLHRQLLVVVECENHSLLLWQVIDCIRETLLHLTLQATEQWVFLR